MHPVKELSISKVIRSRSYVVIQARAEHSCLEAKKWCKFVATACSGSRALTHCSQWQNKPTTD